MNIVMDLFCIFNISHRFVLSVLAVWSSPYCHCLSVCRISRSSQKHARLSGWEKESGGEPCKGRRGAVQNFPLAIRRDYAASKNKPEHTAAPHHESELTSSPELEPEAMTEPDPEPTTAFKSGYSCASIQVRVYGCASVHVHVEYSYKSMSGSTGNPICLPDYLPEFPPEFLNNKSKTQIEKKTKPAMLCAKMYGKDKVPILSILFCIFTLSFLSASIFML